VPRALRRFPFPAPILLAPLLLAPLALACSSEPKVLTLDIVTGHETDAMTQDPPVARVEVKGTTPEGEEIEAEAAPGGDLDFGEVDGELAYTFEITGFDGPGNVVLRGRSIGGIVLNGVEADTIPLFAQRLGQWARPPGELARAHTRAPAVSVGERYLLTTGGDAPADAAESEEYDLFAWAGARGPTFPFAAETLVSYVDRALAIGGDQAKWLDGDGFADPTPVEGLSYADLSGGSVVLAPDGRVFIVGATRPANETDAVLEISADEETVSVRRLAFPRAGAAAAWVPDVGLVVVGGSATAKGVEVLAQEGTTFAARDFPPDPTTGAAAAPSSLGTLALVGGVLEGAAARTRLLDPRCTSDCSPDPLDAATPPVALTRTAAFSREQGSPVLIVVGDDPAPEGLTRTFLVDYLNATVTELPLREPRLGATAVPAPNGTLALVGGVHPDGTPALTVEMLFPE
jgi:hypothetical protein